MRVKILTFSALLTGFTAVQAPAQNAAQDITDLLLSNRSADCAGVYSASVEDVTRQQRFNSEIEISSDDQH